MKQQEESKGERERYRTGSKREGREEETLKTKEGGRES